MRNFRKDGTLYLQILVQKLINALNGKADPIPENNLVANFTYNIVEYDAGETTIQFNDASFASNLPITNRYWDFGDESGSSTNTNPIYTYSSDGTYSVVLTVHDEYGRTGTITKEIVIDSEPSIYGNFSVSSTELDETQILTATIGVASGAITGYEWKVDGISLNPVNNTVWNPTSTGSYEVYLRATSSLGEYIEITRTIEIVDSSDCIASFSIDRPYRLDTTIELENSSSSSEGIAAYYWNITGNSPTGDLSSGVDYAFVGGTVNTDEDPLIEFYKEGEYTITLKVTDTAGNTDTFSKTIKVPGVVEVPYLPEISNCYVGKNYGNGDFDITVSGTYEPYSITFDSYPPGISDFKALDISYIVEYDQTTGAAVNIFSILDGSSNITITGNVLSLGGKIVNDISNHFAVFTNVRRKEESSGVSLNGRYRSPSDFTATYTSASTITISSLPITISDSSQIVGIKQIKSDNTSKIYNNAAGYTITHSSNILTVYDANGNVIDTLESGDTYEIHINEQDKGYDPSTNSTMVSPLVNVWNQYTDAETLVTAQGLTASYTDFGSEIDMRSYNRLGVYIIADVNNSENVDLKILGKYESGGTDEYDIDGLSEKRLWDTGASDFKKYYEFDVGTIPYVQLQGKAGTVGTTAGDLTIVIDKKWRA